MVIWKMFENRIEFLGDKSQLLFDEYGYARYSSNVISKHVDKYPIDIDGEEIMYRDCQVYSLLGENIDIIYKTTPYKEKQGEITYYSYPIIVYGKESHTSCIMWFQEFVNPMGHMLRYYSKGEQNND